MKGHLLAHAFPKQTFQKVKIRCLFLYNGSENLENTKKKGK